VVFIAGNMPMKTEITPLLIITKLDQYDYTGATAIAVVMLVISFAMLLPINLLQRWSGNREEKVIASHPELVSDYVPEVTG
jgi:sulfate transport system permease protein